LLVGAQKSGTRLGKVRSLVHTETTCELDPRFERC